MIARGAGVSPASDDTAIIRASGRDVRTTSQPAIRNAKSEIV